MDNKILYCAVVLDEQSQGKLKQAFANIVPKDWKNFSHHMTIAFGQGLPEDLVPYLGMKQVLTGTEIGISDMAIALKVEGFPTTNKIPHITVAINVNQGGKPAMSNNIINWSKLPEYIGMDTIKLTGTVEEIKA